MSSVVLVMLTVRPPALPSMATLAIAAWLAAVGALRPSQSAGKVVLAEPSCRVAAKPDVEAAAAA